MNNSASESIVKTTGHITGDGDCDNDGDGDRCLGKRKVQKRAHRSCKFIARGGGALVSARCRLRCLVDIKECLAPEQMKDLLASPLGHMFAFPVIQFQGQVMHHLLKCLQPWSKNRGTLVFLINNHLIEFGPTDFALMTGLSFKNESCCPSSSEFHALHFDGDNKIVLRDLYKKIIKESRKNKTKKKSSSDDLFKLACLYMVYSLFLAKDYTQKTIDMCYFHLIDDVSKFLSYDWGRVAFDCLVDGCHSASMSLLNSLENVENTKRASCNVPGYIYALQAWAYEAIPGLAKHVSCVVPNKEYCIPRMVRWDATNAFGYNHLKRFFVTHSGPAPVDMVPSNEEMQKLLSLGFTNYSKSAIEAPPQSPAEKKKRDHRVSGEDYQENSDVSIPLGKKKRVNREKLKGKRTSSRRTVNGNTLHNMSTEEKEDTPSDREDLYALMSKMNNRLDSVECGILEVKNLLLCVLNMGGNQGKDGRINMEVDASGRKAKSNVEVRVPEMNKVNQCEGDGTTGLKSHSKVSVMQPGVDGGIDVEKDKEEIHSRCDGEAVSSWTKGCSDGDEDDDDMSGRCDAIEDRVARSDGLAPEARFNGPSCGQGLESKSSPYTVAETQSSTSNFCKDLIVVGTDKSGGSEYEFSFFEDYLADTDIMNLTVDPDFDNDFIGHCGLQEYPTQQLITWPCNLSSDFTKNATKGMQLQLPNEVDPPTPIEMPDRVAYKVPADQLDVVRNPLLHSYKAVTKCRRSPRATQKPPKPTKAEPSKRMNRTQRGTSVEKPDSPFDPLDVGLFHGETPEFDAWCTASRKRCASRTSICMPSGLLVECNWFDNIRKPDGWLKNDHVDALTCLLLHKFNRYASAELKQKRDWNVLQYPATDALMRDDIGRINRLVMPYVRGEQPHIDKIAWADLNRVFGVGHVNIVDHWVAYEVNFRAQKITVWDSKSMDWELISPGFYIMGRNIPKIFIKDGLWQLMATTDELSNQWQVVPATTCPQQPNDSDCGIIAQKILECLSFGVDLSGLSGCAGGYWRKIFCAQLFDYSISAIDL